MFDPYSRLRWEMYISGRDDSSYNFKGLFRTLGWTTSFARGRGIYIFISVMNFHLHIDFRMKNSLLNWRLHTAGLNLQNSTQHMQGGVRRRKAWRETQGRHHLRSAEGGLDVSKSWWQFQTTPIPNPLKPTSSHIQYTRHASSKAQRVLLKARKVAHKIGTLQTSMERLRRKHTKLIRESLGQ